MLTSPRRRLLPASCHEARHRRRHILVHLGSILRPLLLLSHPRTAATALQGVGPRANRAFRREIWWNTIGPPRCQKLARASGRRPSYRLIMDRRGVMAPSNSNLPSTLQPYVTALPPPRLSQQYPPASQQLLQTLFDKAQPAASIPTTTCSCRERCRAHHQHSSGLLHMKADRGPLHPRRLRLHYQSAVAALEARGPPRRRNQRL
ncbi:hypothetical protein DFJ73DRAFT_864268 [Zopfochytrium polystomum]|nr:hypothetical protein DFJ73DRAFT_864268 [Zopfochytrium polystomum]